MTSWLKFGVLVTSILASCGGSFRFVMTQKNAFVVRHYSGSKSLILHFQSSFGSSFEKKMGENHDCHFPRIGALGDERVSSFPTKNSESNDHVYIGLNALLCRGFREASLKHIE